MKIQKKNLYLAGLLLLIVIVLAASVLVPRNLNIVLAKQGLLKGSAKVIYVVPKGGKDEQIREMTKEEKKAFLKSMKNQSVQLRGRKNIKKVEDEYYTVGLGEKDTVSIMFSVDEDGYLYLKGKAYKFSKKSGTTMYDTVKNAYESK